MNLSIGFSPPTSPSVTFLMMNVTSGAESVCSELVQRSICRERVIECVCSCVDNLFINVKLNPYFVIVEMMVVDDGRCNDEFVNPATDERQLSGKSSSGIRFMFRGRPWYWLLLPL